MFPPTALVRPFYYICACKRQKAAKFRRLNSKRCQNQTPRAARLFKYTFYMLARGWLVFLDLPGTGWADWMLAADAACC